LSKERQAYLKEDKNEANYVMHRVNDYLERYEGNNLIYIFAEQLAKIKQPIIKNDNFDIFAQEKAWKEELESRCDKGTRNMVDFFLRQIWALQT